MEAGEEPATRTEQNRIQYFTQNHPSKGGFVLGYMCDIINHRIYTYIYIMKKENILNLFLLVVIGTSAVVGTVSAATTISTNIVTEGTLSVTATSSLLGYVGIGTTTPLANEKLSVNGEIMLLPDNQGYMGNFGGAGITNFYVGTNIKNVNGTPTQVDPSGGSWFTVFSNANNYGYRVGHLSAGTTWASNKFFFQVSKTGKVELGAALSNGPDSIVDTLQIASSTNATTTLRIGQTGQNKGSCLALYDSAGTPIYAYVAAGQTAFTLSTTACR